MKKCSYLLKRCINFLYYCAKLSRYLVENHDLVVRAFAMGAERTVETTQLAPDRLAASANG